MTEVAGAARSSLLRQAEHWSRALRALGDLDAIAAPAAWASLDADVAAPIERSFREALADLGGRVERIRRRAARGPAEDLPAVADAMTALRHRYVRTETALDFYGDAVNTRTSPSLQALLRGLDRLADLSMRRLLEPLGKRTPPVVTYVDRGLGASILKAGLRLWEPSMVSPAAAIKIARHNLLRPTALVHETGHQVAHILGWNDELADVLREGLVGDSDELAEVWSSWASEIAADAYSLVQTGYASAANLHDVLAGDAEYVFRFVPGDPHPISYLRVLLVAEMCSVSYGTGPWNPLVDAWIARYRLEEAEPEVAQLVTASIPLLTKIAKLCLETPMRGFGGHALVEWIDPSEVSPASLARLGRAAGRSLLTSPVWSQSGSMRVFALLGLRMATDAGHTDTLHQEQAQWLRRLGELPVAA